MGARVEDLSGLPGWPRRLSKEQAAAYVGVSPPTFEWEIRAGKWPRPERVGGKRRSDGTVVGGRLLWDRAALDRAQDERSGIVVASGAPAGEPELNPWD